MRTPDANLAHRIRRVKCDEAKPECVRCISTGRKCDGYLLIDMTKSHSDTSTIQAIPPGCLSIGGQQWEFVGDDQERRSFDFFRKRTALQLSGFFDSEFWNRSVPQATLHEPAIRHAVLALSALHERFESGDNSILIKTWNRNEGGFALQQYNKSIHYLIRPNNRCKQSVHVCLVACMLFACFEALRGHTGSALSHISAGVKILNEVQLRGDGRETHETLNIASSPFVELGNLEVSFNRLDMQAAQLLGSKPMVISRLSKEAPGFHHHIPASFKSIEEARNSLDFHWNGAILLLNNLESQSPIRVTGVEAQENEYLDIFERWLVAFQRFLRESSGSLQTKDIQAARFLEISNRFMFIILDANVKKVSTSETVWDLYLENYRHIVNLAMLIDDLSEKDPKTNFERSPVFSLDMNIVAPLYAVAHKCRDPFIRRRAVSFLRSTPRQEGIWDSMQTAHVAETLIEIEETGLEPVTCAQDVPDWARISDVSVKFDLEGRLGMVTYSRPKGPEGARLTQTSKFTW